MKFTAAEDPEERNLTAHLAESRAKCLPYLHGIARKRGSSLAVSATEHVPEDSNRSSTDLYRVESDTKASLTFFQRTDKGFEGTDLKTDGAVWGAFPNQTTRLERLFNYDFHQLLAENIRSASDGSEEGMAYIHLPYNNMGVSLLRHVSLTTRPELTLESFITSGQK